ncbi:MAG TPA: hypothetical protein VHN14_27370 [Kofleriaceae bacterium]|jgi:Tfp pilus assembly protein PilP|nr:hypothetical protein [Kofleriaceae bacterium]
MRAGRAGPVKLAGAACVLVGLGLAAASAGCDDDEVDVAPAGRPARPATPATPATPGAGGPNHKPLAEKLHIEDRISCPIPDSPSDPKDGGCDPKAPSCPEHLYCLRLVQGNFCEPCPERDGIRHVFEERDFAVEQNRDPFQSNLLAQLSIVKSPAIPLDPTKKCLREDQMVASKYSYTDLKLVGIVTQGTRRKVLMMGGPLGYIIKRGDCVGKEKAVVKDIADGYITFLVDPDTSIANQRSSEEYSVWLNPKRLAVNAPVLPIPVPRTGGAPAVAPPAMAPAQAGPGTAGTPATESPPGAPRKP